MKKLIYLLSYLLLISCTNDFLDELPTTVVTPQFMDDYDQMLNSRSVIRGVADEYLYLSDNSFEEVFRPEFRSKQRAYFWIDEIYQEDEIPILWNNPYKKIYTYNVIIAQVETSQGGTDTEKKKIKAEAIVGKAFDLFYLANTFCKQYDKTTASTDLGIPIVNSISVSDSIPDRGTLQEVYDYITNSTHEAIPFLPDDSPDDNYRASKLAAYGLLARVYYYMSEYAKAEEFAEKVLSIRNQVYNLNTTTDYNTIQLINHQEEFYARVLANSGIYGPNYFYISQELTDTYNLSNDLRLHTDSDNTNAYATLEPFGFTGLYENKKELNLGFSVQEMLFIQAEAKARSGNLSEAVNIINNFLRTRIDTSGFTPFVSTTQEEVIDWITIERRKELYFRGLRWFDMRKLSKENKMPTVSRTFENFETGAISPFTLEGNSKKYTLLIPSQILGFNPDMSQNER
ncbi:RagB/SusD family nutrient uptake outer membrane protein [Aquimarina sp. I32.4]|uniref:RagB/SusD family nutrient uptake outer membrane protein n=1 Tax=Aquimarina sp. I32.4 TaxID=2053903 RepID=UPI000CDE97F7|nr:RagB/SusD family nutrient uptake outer membrane protein [Aquimarina sp. I32.4]